MSEEQNRGVDGSWPERIARITVGMPRLEVEQILGQPTFDTDIAGVGVVYGPSDRIEFWESPSRIGQITVYYSPDGKVTKTAP